MSALKQEDGKKWIRGLLAVASAIVTYVGYVFVRQLGDWFDLEAKVQNFRFTSQGIALALGVATFVLVVKNQKAITFLDQVFGELLKVLWPNKESVFQLTVGIIIAVAISSGVLVLVDLGIRELLTLLY